MTAVMTMASESESERECQGQPGRVAPVINRNRCEAKARCVEVCPFDALFWSPEYEYSEPHIADLLHDKEKLGEWMETVPEAPELEAGASKK